MTTTAHAPSVALVERLRTRPSFQISVDVDDMSLGLTVATAALSAGVDLVEMGTPLLKTEGVRNVVPAFRAHFPDAMLLADMKTMDGGGFEAKGVYGGGANIIDFLSAAGTATARAVCAVRDQFRQDDPTLPRLAFADILLPQQGPAQAAVETAERMVEAGVDGVGLHLQLDARRADPELFRSSYLSDAARAVYAAVGDRVSVQVVGGLTIAQAKALAADGLKAFVISGNLGEDDGTPRYTLPADQLQRHIAGFIAEVGG
ncbi:orotidine 5'-phosphate decarboxylase / HUMPS family protein [Devosia sp.]|uniref:orotidine 5'-phosphate decarboxylase / HUMPS family protein n=1 Tax=Devosia sp. TaxID=1871048 RepID=UPI003A95A9F0